MMQAGMQQYMVKRT